MPVTLVDSTENSDAGGIAARQGFRFQDHVAASLVVEMLADPTISQIECETAEDIVIRWISSAAVDIEYVQVKTTDADGKWTITELTSREKGKELSSLCEKSLMCDKYGQRVRFRFVTKREVRKDLKPFRKEWSKRVPGDAALDALVPRIGKKYKDISSPSERTLTDWATSFYWQVEPTEASLKSATINHLLRLAQADGCIPPWSLINDTYERIVKRVASMADASKDDPEAKRWDRADLLNWWKAQIDLINKEAAGSLKVYRTKTPAFFTEFHKEVDVSQKRALYSYDAEYDGDAWRRDELIDYLIDRIPEVSLPASVLATFGYLSARKLSSQALKALDSHGITSEREIISNLLLHSILRHHFDSEPIACKLYYLVGGQMRSTNAHIVQTLERDELWLGRSRLVTATDYEETVKATIAELTSALDPSLLKEDRDLIVQLRDPQHMRPDSLGRVLNASGKIADLLAILKLPILVAYDSEVIARGFEPTYLAKLVEEVTAAYEKLKKKLSGPLEAVEIVIFLIPVECASTLASEFGKKLRGIK
jgi:hypothetical protein